MDTLAYWEETAEPSCIAGAKATVGKLLMTKNHIVVTQNVMVCGSGVFE